MKRPMVWAVVPYIVGIALADTGWIPFWYALAACAAMTALAYAAKASRTVTLLPVLFGLGFANQAFHLSQIPADFIVDFTDTLLIFHRETIGERRKLSWVRAFEGCHILLDDLPVVIIR